MLRYFCTFFVFSDSIFQYLLYLLAETEANPQFNEQTEQTPLPKPFVNAQTMRPMRMREYTTMNNKYDYLLE